jgi:hypothetical protein
MSITSVSQDYRNIFVGRYAGTMKQTQLPNNTVFYDYNALAEIIYGDSSIQQVYFKDSCAWSPWSYAIGTQVAWPDSTLRTWGNSNSIHGHLFSNDSLYFSWAHISPSSTDVEQFFGFKLYSTVGVKELSKQENELLISPQPATDVIYIQSTQLVFRQEDIPIIYDISGKQYTIPIQYINKNTYKLDVNSLNAGMYVIAIKTEQGIVRKKVIVE